MLVGWRTVYKSGLFRGYSGRIPTITPPRLKVNFMASVYKIIRCLPIEMEIFDCDLEMYLNSIRNELMKKKPR